MPAASDARAKIRRKVLAFPEVAVPAETDDAVIVGALVNGDVRAPRLAWQKLSPMVCRVLRRAFGPGYDIDDLVQEVFLTLFERVRTLRDPQALRAFVLSITAHTIRYELRRKAARRWLRFEEPPSAQAKDVQLDSREALAHFYRILDCLGSADRTAFVLRFIEGLDLEKVAQALGVSVSTAKRRLQRARSRVLYRARRDEALVDYVTSLEYRGDERRGEWS
jgi:RNA polymerase sigma-70 factor, ECF subfamily